MAVKEEGTYELYIDGSHKEFLGIRTCCFVAVSASVCGPTPPSCTRMMQVSNGVGVSTSPGIEHARQQAEAPGTCRTPPLCDDRNPRTLSTAGPAIFHGASTSLL